MQTEPLGKGGEIYWFKAFKEISVQSLANHKAECVQTWCQHTTKNINFKKIFQKSYETNKQQNATNSKLWGEGGKEFLELPFDIIKNM